MARQSRKEQLKAWKRQQAVAAFEALPLPPSALRQLFVDLGSALDHEGCNHTRKLTLRWLRSRALPEVPVLEWLDSNGGYCDCEVLLNAEERFEEALRGAPEE